MHRSQGKVIAIATFIVSLKVIDTYSNDPAIGQIAEGAGNRCSGCVINDCERQSGVQSSLRPATENEARAAIDGNSVCCHLIATRVVALGFESVLIGRVAIQCKRALDGESDLFTGLGSRSEKSLRTNPKTPALP